MTSTDNPSSTQPSLVPFRLTRAGIIMSADPSDPLEAEGVLNPATAWGSDGDLYLYPRLVAAGNFSRIGKARVIVVDGVPVSVERQGVVLEPDRPWERGVRHGGVEDPRITWVPSLDAHVMTYVAFGPFGPRPAVAISRDQESWTRLGPFQFEYDDALEIDLNLYPNKDVLFFPDVVPDPDGRPSYAVIHRPMWEFALASATEVAPLPAGTTDSRASIWISYIPEEDVRADISALTRPRGHRFVAGSEFEWESLKVGGGPPPIRVDEGWLLIYHGVSGEIHDDPFVPQTKVFYSVGALILDATDPSQVIARTPEPLLVPETPDELVGTVGNVVFPTAIESIEGKHYVFYGMADAKIGVALLERNLESNG
jgi:beta-1,2-mannobiose phosphorylase / 1,2-beta-oligomannan phosphorylase